MAWAYFTNAGARKVATAIGGYTTIASASAIAVITGATHLLTGTTSVNTMTGGSLGGVVTIVASGQATGICVVLNHATGANNLSLRDSANIGLYAGESVTFAFDGAKWVEADRNLKTVLATVSVTSNVTVTATTEATAAAIATLPAITFDGATPMKIEFYCGLTSLSVVAATGQTSVWDSSTEVNKYTYIDQTYTSNVGVAIFLPITPTAAAHTYSVRGWVSSGNNIYYAGTVGGGAGVYGPIYMAISRAI